MAAARRRKSAGTKRSGGSRKSGSILLKILFWIVVLPLSAAAIFWLTLPAVEPLRHKFPESTALIDARAGEARAQGKAARKAQKFVPLAQISRFLQDAVVNSEDARFYMHGAFDSIELNKAIDKAMEDHKLGRGASTLTQQLAKNLWLGEHRSLWRKGREAAMAYRLESLGKERILELYLNVVEWGDGIYGAEAASQRWFSVHARDLSPEQAAILTAMLPAPRKRNPRRPSQRLKTRAVQVLDLFGEYKQLSPGDLAAARERLHRALGS